MEKLFRAEKQIQDLKDTYEAVTTSYDDVKDKKIIELAKQKRQLQMTVESLRTKAAKAAETALKFKKELDGGHADNLSVASGTPLKSTPASMTKKTQGLNDTAASAFGTADDSKKVKELEKKVTKLRNEN